MVEKTKAGKAKRKPREPIPCEVPGCLKTLIPGVSGARGRCFMHYQRLVRGADEEKANAPGPLVEGPFKSFTVRILDVHADELREEIERGDESLSEWLRRAVEERLERKRKFRAAAASLRKS